MRQQRIYPREFTVLAEIASRGEAQGVDALMGLRVPGADEPLDRNEAWKAINWLWFQDYIQVDNDRLPFEYTLTEAGRLVLKSAAEGIGPDKHKAALDKLVSQFGEIKIAADPAQTKRALVVPYVIDHETEESTGELDMDEARWVYYSGAIKKASSEDAEAILEKEERAA